jgi:hypothetical protein
MMQFRLLLTVLLLVPTACASGDTSSIIDTTTSLPVSPGTSPSELPPTSTRSPTTSPSPTPTEQPTPSDEPEPEPSFAEAPEPKVFDGSGAKVIRDVKFEADGPLVVTGTHTGTANFIVELVPASGGDSALLFNEIGRYDGQVAESEFSAGTYRVSVDADGGWTLKFELPQPRGDEKHIPAPFEGAGAKVLRFVSDDTIQPIVTADHTGTSNFIVEVIGYGDLEGHILIFNEIGPFNGETIADEMPTGNYLLAVVADGSWSLTFER